MAPSRSRGGPRTRQGANVGRSPKKTYKLKRLPERGEKFIPRGGGAVQPNGLSRFLTTQTPNLPPRAPRWAATFPHTPAKRGGSAMVRFPRLHTWSSEVDRKSLGIHPWRLPRPARQNAFAALPHGRKSAAVPLGSEPVLSPSKGEASVSPVLAKPKGSESLENSGHQVILRLFWGGGVHRRANGDEFDTLSWCGGKLVRIPSGRRKFANSPVAAKIAGKSPPEKENGLK